MASILKWARSATRRKPSPPLRFPTTGYELISDAQPLDEEQIEGFKRGLYYPVNIGDMLMSKYQVVGKLGYGVMSTVWLARNLLAHEYVSLKVYTRNGDPQKEFETYQHLNTKADNILSEIEDKSILGAFTEAEMKHPSPRKVVNDVTVYASRRFDVPRIFGDSVLSDFGSAVRGDLKRNHGAGPQIYRAPEVMIKAAWSYPIDIWNVGAMIWDLFEGEHMFHGQDSDGEGYSTRAHLAEVIGMLGPPPLDFLERGVRTPEFFDEQGKWIADMPIAKDMELEKLELGLQGRNKELFLNMMRGMLQWRPEDRKSAGQLADDPWINEIHIT
ncbi:putative protein kinase domain-containing protein [Botrytis cinerea BcDW1]|uniref:non-specific serine/threonine protein kinase n=1 Tax=Botryotinia fuckeliana (strain BcDW1) TaxID=1290391 RepID=M7UDI1_BOTF1|nr:putative protein kinase domain-containing protein [Botrytis cinerea BcDW1]